MKEYTLCYLFDETCDAVALTKVTKEAWNKGKINGIGGKVEKGDVVGDSWF